MAEDPIMLPEVKITAKKVEPKKYKEAVVKLYPKGEAKKSQIDSLVKAGRGALMGSPSMAPGKIAEYGEVASDNIKQLLRGRKTISKD